MASEICSLFFFEASTMYRSQSFFFNCALDHRDLHSFPTRRSSDLGLELVRALDELRGAVVLQPAPQHGSARTRVGSRVGVVVLQRPEVAVVIGPRAAAGMHAR